MYYLYKLPLTQNADCIAQKLSSGQQKMELPQKGNCIYTFVAYTYVIF